jgi:two-component system phosphate regulon sensor histidine kinase PhoR
VAHIEPDCRLTADRDLLFQALANLLDNAIKYTPAGGRVRVRVGAEGERAVLEVEDTGVGIEPAEQERIFERFYRVEKDRSDASGSTGLGLAICRHIILNHRGRIWVESPPEGKSRGSAFMFTLPLVEDEAVA